MNYKPYAFVAAILVLLACIVYVLALDTAEPSVTITPAEAEKFTKATTLLYRNDEGTDLIVAYAGDLVRVTGFGYNEATLRQVPAASGVKYEGTDGLVFHSKGDEVLLETPQARLFTGREVTTVEEASPVVTEELPVPPPTPAASTTATSTLIGVWRWQSGTNDGADITLTNPEKYTLTFTTEGTVSGATDCNGFGGSYTQADGTLTMTDFMSTLMYCEGSTEQTFTNLLSRQTLTMQTISDTELVLESGSLSLRFTR